MHELGTGVFGWHSHERISDRYGLVELYDHTSGPIGQPKAIKLAQIKQGIHGKLLAIVKETRESAHIGDLFHGVSPVTPNVGDTIVLGEGTIFFEGDAVGLRPDDGRGELWLDINALYRAHDQTVTLAFEETTTH